MWFIVKLVCTIIILQINYMLNEDKNWAIDVPGLRGNLQEARKHCDPRIMVVINPGNPTGKKMKISMYAGCVQYNYT